MGNCGGEERALIEVLVVLVLGAALAFVVAWRAAISVLIASRIAMREIILSRETTQENVSAEALCLEPSRSDSRPLPPPP